MIFIINHTDSDKVETTPLNEISVLVDSSDEMLFKLIDKKGNEIKPWIASSLSPDGDPVTTLINHISKQDFVNLNGHAKTRFDLEYDYIPRIIVGNLIFSRARWRLKKNDLLWIEGFKNIDSKKFSEVREFLHKYNLPEVGYLYTDNNSKPVFITFNSFIGIEQFVRIDKKCDNFVYLEECLPDLDSHIIEDNLENKYASEVWSALCPQE